MKGYKTSTEYTKLWELINQGYRVPAWITIERHGLDFSHLVEVYINKAYGEYRIGTRGIGYDQGHSKDGFIETCQWLKLEYIVPTEI